MTTWRRHAPGAPVPDALAAAIARGWRGLTIVTGREDDRPVTLVRAAEPAGPSPGGARLHVRVEPLAPGPVPGRLVVQLADEGSGLPGVDSLALDLRLAGVRAVVRRLAEAGALVLDASRPERGRLHRVSPEPAAELLRTASARAGEWHVSDPHGGLASSVRWRIDADAAMPRLMAGARRGDLPLLALPAGSRSLPRTLAALAAMVSHLAPEQAAHLARAAAAGRVTLAEVALGGPPTLTALRMLRLGPEEA